MDEVLFSNIRLKKNTFYFIYAGEVKAYGVNTFLKEALSRKLRKQVEFIAIIPDMLEEYHYENVMVVNPVGQRLCLETGKKVSCRIPARLFASAVSQNREVLRLVDSLLKAQQEVFIYMFESLPEFTLDRLPGVRVIGPEADLSHKWNNKIYQHQAFNVSVPMPNFTVCDGVTDMVEQTNTLWRKWKDGIFVSLEYSASGSNSCAIYSKEDMLQKMKNKFENPDARYLITEYIPHIYDPTVLAVVANENDVYVGGVADQHIVDINKFRGSTFPSMLPIGVTDELKAYTKIIGKQLGRTGYRGIFGCDYIVDKEGNIFFVEVNARKQGTTMEMCCTLENNLPDGSATLPELEYYAVTESRFPANTVEMSGNPRSIHWGTYNYKLEHDILTNGRVSMAVSRNQKMKGPCSERLPPARRWMKNSVLWNI
jgi:hypothetical protein